MNVIEPEGGSASRITGSPVCLLKKSSTCANGAPLKLNPMRTDSALARSAESSPGSETGCAACANAEHGIPAAANTIAAIRTRVFD